MSNQELPDRIKATLTIDLDFAKEDQPLIADVLQSIIDNINISSSGNGSPTAKSHFTYKLESNLPKVPMTMDVLLDMVDQTLEPGEPTAREQIAESMRTDYDQACEWWEDLAEAQKTWFQQAYPQAKLVTAAWDIFKSMSFADKVYFQTMR